MEFAIPSMGDEFRDGQVHRNRLSGSVGFDWQRIRLDQCHHRGSIRFSHSVRNQFELRHHDQRMKWNLLGNFFATVFFVGPGILLSIRFFKGPRFPWWLAVVLSLLIGWGCLIGASVCTTKDLTSQMQAFENRGEPVPDQLMEDWASDAPGAFAVVLGWAFSVFFLGLWSVVYALAHLLRKAVRRSGGGEASVAADT
ncbi:MAG: hypothetical protein ACJASX_002164 [Limisphaerales bacterium]|jgi:hypothetical protein